jgi:hypothetical protein
MSVVALPGRRGVGRPRKARTVAELAFEVFEEVGASPIVAPTTADLSPYRTDPVLYALERLGVVLMPQQAAVAYAVAGQWHRITSEMAKLSRMRNPGKRKIAIRAAVKTGKTRLLIVLALWFYECFRGAKFLMTAAIGNQIRTVLWPELGDILLAAPHRPDGRKARNPETGFVSEDETRSIRGFTGRNVESVAGRSGNQIIAIDEASALEQDKARALTGNIMGSDDGSHLEQGSDDLGGPLVLFSNPTRNSGPLYDAFHSLAEHFTTFHFDGEEIAEWNARQPVRVKYIITKEKIAEQREMYGEDDPFYIIRVRGDFLTSEEGKIIDMTTIVAMRARWDELWCDADGRRLEGQALLERRKKLGRDLSLGPLVIGFDPAGAMKRSDEIAYAIVRGAVCLEVITRRSLSTDQALAELYRLLAAYRAPDETPTVQFDADGEIGATFKGRLAAESEERRMRRPGTAFHARGIRAGSKRVRQPMAFKIVRDEMYKTLGEWAMTGAIPPDPKLEAELYEPVWLPLSTGHATATGKETLREKLHRSPDRADGLMLAVFRPISLDAEPGEAAAAPPPVDMFDAAAQFDQQEAGDPWWPKD